MPNTDEIHEYARKLLISKSPRGGSGEAHCIRQLRLAIERWEEECGQHVQRARQAGGRR